MSRCCELRVKREQYKIGNYSLFQEFRLDTVEPAAGCYPPQIRRFPTGYPQCFAQAFPSKSAGFPAFFLNFSARISTGILFGIFRNVFAAIPEELAGSAGEKNGEKRAGKAICGKVRRSRSIVGRQSVFRGAFRSVHTCCGTWNSALNTRRRRLRRRRSCRRRSARPDLKAPRRERGGRRGGCRGSAGLRRRA